MEFIRRARFFLRRLTLPAVQLFESNRISPRTMPSLQFLTCHLLIEWMKIEFELCNGWCTFFFLKKLFVLIIRWTNLKEDGVKNISLKRFGVLFYWIIYPTKKPENVSTFT